MFLREKSGQNEMHTSENEEIKQQQAVNVTGGTAPMDLKDAVLGDLAIN